jgi:tRNA (uracil-5-)-methyltransferase TRM9
MTNRDAHPASLFFYRYNKSMDAVTSQRLIALNRRFYTEFGAAFSATRKRLQPGVQHILDELTGTERILDLGCGNGYLARRLAARGHSGAYLGLDFSVPLLETAGSQAAGLAITFREADLTAPDWDASLEEKTVPFSLLPSSFDLIFAFAVLHHIPGRSLRLGILQKIRRLLAPGGRFIHSEWQFLNSEKMRGRIQPWEPAGLSAADVEEGDTLLDWRSGGSGLRYVHHFSAPELAGLAAESGFRIVESFFSDGQGGRLSLYQYWEGL